MYNIWVSGDWHLYNHINNSAHPARSAKMVDEMIDNYSRMIDESDLFIFLGDLCDAETMTKEEESNIIRILQCIKGTRIMCRGNHDHMEDSYYISLGFDKVCDIGTIGHLVFSHKPHRVNQDEVNVHAHLHGQYTTGLGYQHIDSYWAVLRDKSHLTKPTLLDDLFLIAEQKDHSAEPDWAKPNVSITNAYTSNAAAIEDWNANMAVLDLSEYINLGPVDESVENIEYSDSILDEVLFTDISSTQYWEADDSSAEKAEESLKYGDSKPTHKVHGKNEVIAESMSNLTNLTSTLSENSIKFKEIKKIVDLIPKEEHHWFYHGEEFKDSPYVKYRNVKYIPGTKNGGFIDIYAFDDEPHLGIIVVAVSPKARHKGIASALVRQAIAEAPKYGFTKLYWRADIDNAASIELAKSLGFEEISDLKKNPDQRKFIYNIDDTLSEATKNYKDTSDVRTMDRDEKKKVAEKYGLRAVGQETFSEKENERKTPEQRLAERNKARLDALEKARKVKKRKATIRKIKSHIPGVKNESVGDESYGRLNVKTTNTENPNDGLSTKAVKLTFYDNDKNIGHAYISSVDTDEGFLYNFEVNKAYRGKGYSNDMMRYILANYSVTDLTVTPDNDIAIKVYKKFGFRVKKEVEDSTNGNRKVLWMKHPKNTAIKRLEESSDVVDDHTPDMEVEDSPLYGQKKDFFYNYNYPKESDETDRKIVIDESASSGRVYYFISNEKLEDDEYPVGKCLYKTLEDAIDNHRWQCKYQYKIQLPCTTYLYRTVPGNYKMRLSDQYCGVYWSIDKIPLTFIKEITISDEVQNESVGDESYGRLNVKPTILYHGSNQKYSTLLANSNFTKDGKNSSVLYATPYYDFALTYAGKMWSDFDIIQIWDGTKQILAEVYPGAFKKFFNCSGYVYELKSSSFIRGNSVEEYISSANIDPVKIHSVQNILAGLENSGTVLYYYPNLPNQIHSRKQYLADKCREHNSNINVVEKIMKKRGVNLDESACHLNEMAYEDYADHYLTRLKSLARKYNDKSEIFSHVAKVLKMDVMDLPDFKCKLLVSGERQLCYSMIDPEEPFEVRCEFEKYLKDMIKELEEDRKDYPNTGSIWTADAEGTIYIDLKNLENVMEESVKRVTEDGETVPEKCPKCGAKIGLYLKGEPVWLCSNKDCGAYYGTAPCNETANKNVLNRIIEFNRALNGYQYGLSRHGEQIMKQNTTGEDYDMYYRVASPKQFERQNGGICWDFATYEAHVFSTKFKNIKYKTYYVVFDIPPYYPSHTFLVFEYNNKYYYFESSFVKYRGVYEANSVSDIINFVLFNMSTYNDKPDTKKIQDAVLKNDYLLLEYDALNPDIPGSTTAEYMKLVERIGKPVINKYSSKFDVTRVELQSMNESSNKSADPITLNELKSLGIRDLRTFQRWLRNNVKYENFTKLKTPREVMESKKGSCHDQVMFEMDVLRTLGYQPRAYLALEYNGQQGGETHSYVIVEDNGKMYWLENAWNRYANLNIVDRYNFLEQAHEERVWGDINRFPEMEIKRFVGESGDDLQILIDKTFNEKRPMEESANSAQLFFVSRDKALNGSTLHPRVPDNFLVKNGYEDGKTKRVCFSTSINGCLRALSQNLKNTDLYVYQPINVKSVITPTIKQVPDVSITGERWVTHSVKLQYVGKIHISTDTGEDGIMYHYGPNNKYSAELYDWNWEWVDKSVSESSTGRNLAKDLPIIWNNILANASSTGNWERVEKGFETAIRKADSMERINYLRRDLSIAIPTLERMAKNAKPDSKNSPEKIKKHIKWINDVARPMLNDRAKEIRKSLKESYQFELLDAVQFIDHEPVNESSEKNKKLYPVYIVLVHSGTAISNVIKSVSHSEFSHASISFDSSLDKMYSFARKDPTNPFVGGFRYESIGKGFYEQKKIPYAVYMVPCTESQIKKMKKRLNYFIENESKFKFDFVGLVTNYFGIIANPENRWFCSRFVSDILNAGAPKNHPYVKEPSLQDPDDFKDTDYAELIVSGPDLTKYDQHEVDRISKKLLRMFNLKNKIQNESSIIDFSGLDLYDDVILDYHLSNMDEAVTQDFLNYVKSFKVKFDKNGNIIIRRREYDQLDMHFRNSVKLIKAAEKAGDLNTVKDELCKLYYMANLITTQYLNTPSEQTKKEVRKDMIDLRAVILNVFGQHLKFIMTHDPKFNFNEYYAKTKYSQDFVINQSAISAIGKTIITVLS